MAKITIHYEAAADAQMQVLGTPGFVALRLPCEGDSSIILSMPDAVADHLQLSIAKLRISELAKSAPAEFVTLAQAADRALDQLAKTCAAARRVSALEPVAQPDNVFTLAPRKPS